MSDNADATITLDPYTAPQRWAAAWSQTTLAGWLNVYKQDAVYIDHAFRLRCQGHPVLKRHFEIWRNSNPDFVLSINPSYPIYWLEAKGKKGEELIRVSFRTTNRGTFMRDTPRKQASGRSFDFTAVVDLVVSKADGLIVEVQEWYSVDFDQSIEVEKYRDATV